MISFALLFSFMSSPQSTTANAGLNIVRAAKAQIGITTGYDPAYVKLKYPGGDVPKETGVCTDVIIRALRTAVQADLQQLIHEDRQRSPRAYGPHRADANIDHRRVQDQVVYFRRRNKEVKLSDSVRPGDFVVWRLPNARLHIGIVSDQKSAQGIPLVIHNIGSGVKEEDVLDQWKKIGAYRW